MTLPVDQETRERARREHRVSFVLEAGAGTGKTTLLVDRIELLVRSGAARLDEVAAVTFTENAATTMKLRLRERLEAARARADVPEVERSRAGAALEVLERAPISTIHALCAAMLQERPLECGVIPGFRVADEAETDLLFGAAWGEWLDERLVAGDDDLLAALDEGIPLEGIGPYGERSSLRGLARTLLEQRDLEPLVAEGTVDPAAWRAELDSNARRAAELIETVPAADALAARLHGLVAFTEQARFLKGQALVRHLRKLAVIPRNFGHRPRWPSDDALEGARGIAEWTKTAASAWSAAASAALHGRLVRALLGVVDRYQQKKRAVGVLDFLDLLLLARDALRDRESVRRYFRERFRFLIIDEFQDTDPLQVEIARLLAGDAPGSLTVVGDAKQSIYRFRRAEVALFRRLSQEAQGRPGHAVLHLTQNFRSRPTILRFVNRVFAGLILASEAADQPAYEPLDPPPGLPEEPSVVALAFDAPFAEGDDLLEHEATALAALISEAAAGGFEVRDPATGVGRPSRAGDVMVLSRRLTQLRLLEEALEGAGLRFTVDGGKSFFDRQEVHEVLAVLRAVEDPSDRVSLVAALRSSFFGVSDRDVVSYHLAGGYLRLGPLNDDEERPGAAAVAPAVEVLTDLHARRTEISVASLLERLYERTRILAALTGTRRGEAQIANLEKVAALARQAGELGVLTLRGFTRLLEERVATAREEPDLPVTRPGDPSTLRLLSIHKAKGLESPIVALYDTADNFRIAAETIPLWDEGKIAIGFREGCQPPGWDELRKRDEAKTWAEARRLLYVACTRARDLLVVPRPSADARVGAFWRDLIAALPAASDADVRVIDAATLRVSPPEPLRIELKALAAAEGGDAVAARWNGERTALVAEGGRRPFVPVPATRVAARTAPPAVVGLGGGGRDFGSLVHRILQWIPLDESRHDAVLALAAALAPVHGVDQAGVRRAAESVLRVLALPLLDRARRASSLWRELPLWLPEGEELVEGIVDLVFEEDGQLVVADYKTDPIGEDQALNQAAHHAPQLQLYGRGLTLATGLKVRERLVVFTALGRAVPV